MDVEHLGSGNRICSVVFADIVEYSQKLVSQQVALKARFSALLVVALEHTAAADRHVLDTGDGAALCFLGDPEDALFTASGLRSRVMEAPPDAHPLRLRLGINLGPVRVVKDINGHTNVIGDGINVAQRVMSFADPNQILVSRSYYEVVSRLSPEYAPLFHYVGLHRDKHVRQHEVYEVQLSAAQGEQPVAAAQGIPVSSSPAGTGAGPNGQLDASALGRLTTALTREIGPVARLVVRRTAEHTTDMRTLCEELAENVPEPHRAGFLADLGDLAAVPPSPAKSRGDPLLAGSPVPQSTDAHREIGPELLVRAEQMLARHIGPMARVLVRHAAKKVTNRRELFVHLAAHIDDADNRRIFMADAERT